MTQIRRMVLKSMNISLKVLQLMGDIDFIMNPVVFLWRLLTKTGDLLFSSGVPVWIQSTNHQLFSRFRQRFPVSNLRKRRGTWLKAIHDSQIHVKPIVNELNSFLYSQGIPATIICPGNAQKSLKNNKVYNSGEQIRETPIDNSVKTSVKNSPSI